MALVVNWPRNLASRKEWLVVESNLKIISTHSFMFLYRNQNTNLVSSRSRRDNSAENGQSSDNLEMHIGVE